MDRFKFRVWDSEEKYYIQKDAEFEMRLENGNLVIFCYDDSPTDPSHLDSERGFVELSDKKRYIIEQSTSLKDKNGNLVYEGDIVKGKSWGAYHNTDVKYVPCYGGYLPFAQCPVEQALCFDDLKDIEVVGNIHEN